MIKTMNITNFKAFKESGDFNFKKINVLVGPNSSGKSSFLKALLMMQDTIKSNESEPAFKLTEEIGDYNSIIYGKNPKEKIGFKILFKDVKYQSFYLFEDKDIFSILIRSRLFPSLNSNKEKFDTDEFVFNAMNYNKEDIIQSVSFFVKTSNKNVVVDRFEIKTSSNHYEIFKNKTAYYLNHNGETLDKPNLFKPYKFFFKFNKVKLDICTEPELRIVLDVQMAFKKIEYMINRFLGNMIHLEPFRSQPKRTEYVTNLNYITL